MLCTCTGGTNTHRATGQLNMLLFPLPSDDITLLMSVVTWVTPLSATIVMFSCSVMPSESFDWLLHSPFK